MNYRIINGKILTQTPENDFAITEGDVYVKDGIIHKIGTCENRNGYETVDAKNKLIMPGLINLHTHAYMSCLKNFADDVPFDEWLFKRIMPVEDSLSDDAAFWSSLLACMEMIASGTTCFSDMHMFKSQSCKAASLAGMRAFIGRGLVGEDLYGDGKSRLDQALEEKEEFESDLIKFILSPHAPYSCSDKLLRQVDEVSKQTGMLKQIHLSESTFEVENSLEKYGKTPVEFLSDIGFLDGKTLLAHCVKLSDNDIDLIQNHGSSVVTNPASNAKLGNGFAPIANLLNNGINVCLGTDSVASNNTLNMFREMNLLSLLHKAANGDPTVLSAQTVLKTATVNAAKAVGLADKIGSITEGGFADLIFVDLTSPSLFPNNNIVSSLCYSANGSEVSSVMINGRFVMKNREFLTIDTERVYHEVRLITEKYL